MPTASWRRTRTSSLLSSRPCCARGDAELGPKPALANSDRDRSRTSTTTSGGSIALAIWGKMSSETFRSAGGVGNEISIPKSSTLPEKPGRITKGLEAVLEEHLGLLVAHADQRGIVGDVDWWHHAAGV